MRPLDPRVRGPYRLSNYYSQRVSESDLRTAPASRRVDFLNGRSLEKLAIAAALMLTWLPCIADAASITVVWNRNPEPYVAGYRVIVRDESRVTAQTFDVGNRTWFEFKDALPGRRYYFVVAAYAPGGIYGERSIQISGVADGAPLYEQATRLVCVDAASTDCYTAQVLVAGIDSPSSLLHTTDGRVLFIEDERRVRVIADNTLLGNPALSAPTSRVRFGALALDPSFQTTRHVFVSEIELRGDGTREMSIVRYRDVDNYFGERAVVVSGLSMPASGDAPFTLGTDARIYVALPTASVASTQTAYGARVLRFERDGSVPRDSRGASPVLANGYSRPSALSWDSVQQRLWLAGVDPQWPQPVAVLDLSLPTVDEWPRQPQSVQFDRSGQPGVTTRMDALTVDPTRTDKSSTGLFLLSVADGLRRARLGPAQETIELVTIPFQEFGEPISLTTGPRKDVYVGVRSPAGVRPRVFSIVRLQPWSK